MSFGTAYVAIRADLKPLGTGLKTGYRMVSDTLGRIGRLVTGLGRKLFSLKNIAITALAGWGLKKISDSFIDAASTSEGFRVRLKVLLGGIEKGNRLFKLMADYAGKVPFTYKEIMGSATALAGVMKKGVSEIVQWMPMIGDLAAAAGMTIQETTGQVIRMYSAGAAAADMFRERGILSMLGFTAGVKYTAKETQEMMFKAWNAIGSKFKGATNELAGTWKGLMSMFGDAWFKFRNIIMDAGVFDFLKMGASELLKKIQELMPIIENRLVPRIREIIDRTEIWIRRNQDLIKSKFIEWLGNVKEWAERAISVFKTFWNVLEETATTIDKLWSKWKNFANSDVFKYGMSNYIAGGKMYQLTDILPFSNDLATPIEIPFKATMEGSTKLPFSEKIEELRNKVTDFSNYVENLGTNYTINASGATQALSSALESVNADYEQKLANMVNYIAERQVELEDVSRGHKPYMYTTYRNIIKGQIEEAEGQIAKLTRTWEAEQNLTANITISPTFMTGDSNAARAVAVDIKNALNELSARWN